MTCSINSSKILEWKTQNIESVYSALYINKELSGELPIDTVNKKTTHNITKINGSKSSVEAPKSIVNYHTHPASCYLTEKTIWGFPSGEDSRESVLFGLKGSIAHLVVAIEGTYVCQVNPCVLENLININIPKNQIPIKALKMIQSQKCSINDFYRGLVILLIEIFFRSTHAFRTGEFIKKHNVTPDDYINFTNNFSFKNMFEQEDIDGCTKIKCNKVWTFENSKYKQVTFEKYTDDYEHKENVYICNKIGAVNISKINISKFIKAGGLNPIKQYNFTNSDNYDIKSDYWFLTKIYYHTIKINNNVNGGEFLYKDLSDNNKQYTLKEIAKGYGHNNISFIKTENPLFYFFDITGSCTYNDIQKIINSCPQKSIGHDKYGQKKSQTSNKNTRIDLVFFGSDNCSHCGVFLDSFNDIKSSKKCPENLKNVFIKINKFDDISKAIEEANKHSTIKKIKTIPSLFHNNKLIDHHILLKRGLVVYKNLS
jgi:hypothetical protein